MATVTSTKQNNISAMIFDSYQMIRSMIHNRRLIGKLAKAELSQAYAGQVFGAWWNYIQPIFLICVYFFLFGVVFKEHITGTKGFHYDYTTYLLAGMIPWLNYQTNMVKTCTSIYGSANLVQQVIFPIEILPVKSVVASIFPLIASFMILFGYVLIKYHTIPLTYLYLPLLIGLQTVSIIGLGFLLSALSCFVKDFKDFIVLYTMVGIYFMPIVFIPKWVPTLFKPLLYANPYSYMIWCYQDVLYFGYMAHPIAWIVNIVFSFLLFGVGALVFNSLRPLFGDAI